MTRASGLRCAPEQHAHEKEECHYLLEQMGNLAHARLMDLITLFGRHVIPACSKGIRAEE
jgi:hypothetical protein